MNALNAFTVTIVNLFLVAYSDTSIAFFGAYFKIQQLIIMTINGLIQGCLPIMIQIFRQMFFLIPIMWILEKALLINGIWIVFPVTELLAFVAAVILFMRLRIQNNNKDIVGGK
jgi:Na+-driven multidrug efflux pump